MTFRQLEAFLLAARLGTLAAAADALGVTQSGMSRLISELEKNVGFALFFRSGRGLETTAQGRAFLREVERLFKGHESLRDAADQIRRGQKERLRIACLPTLSTALLPGTIQRFHAARPNVLIEIETASYGETLNLVLERRVDLGITFEAPMTAGLIVQPLAEAAYVFAAHESHPLAGREVVSAEDLSGIQLIGVIPHRWHDATNAEILRDELEQSSEHQILCQTSATRYACVAADLAATLGEPFASPLFRPLGVAVRPFTPRLVIRYALILPSDAETLPEAVNFRAALLDELDDFATRHGLDIRSLRGEPVVQQSPEKVE